MRETRLMVLWMFSCVGKDWCQLANLFYFYRLHSWSRAAAMDLGGKYSWNVKIAQLQNDWCNALSHFQKDCRRMFWILSFISAPPFTVIKLSLLLQGFISCIASLSLRDSCYFSAVSNTKLQRCSALGLSYLKYLKTSSLASVPVLKVYCILSVSCVQPIGLKAHAHLNYISLPLNMLAGDRVCQLLIK